jgi:hypothetical protein
MAQNVNAAQPGKLDIFVKIPFKQLRQASREVYMSTPAVPI